MARHKHVHIARKDDVGNSFHVLLFFTIQLGRGIESGGTSSSCRNLRPAVLVCSLCNYPKGVFPNSHDRFMR